MDALTRLWEGRPNLTLTQLLGLLETHGAGWNATDAEALDILRTLSAESPAALTDIPGATIPRDASSSRAPIQVIAGRYLITTEGPEQRITLSADRIAVRPVPTSRNDATYHPPQPVIWTHGGVRACTVAQPLVVLDTEGISHHLGLVSSIKALTAPDTTPRTSSHQGETDDHELHSLDGLVRNTLDGVFLLELEEATVLVDRSLWIFSAGRRELHRERLRWVELTICTVGQPLRISLTQGEVREFAPLRRITILE